MESFDTFFKQKLLNAKTKAKNKFKKRPIDKLNRKEHTYYNDRMNGVKLDGSNVMDSNHTSSQTFVPRG